ncbi:MAG: hypothetical protein R2836_05440 [Chitinophagales bacterium]
MVLANGCDSITTFNVTVNQSVVTTSTSTSCNPADVGTNMTGPFTMANGCDSTHYDTVSLAPYTTASLLFRDAIRLKQTVIGILLLLLLTILFLWG